MEVLEGEDVEAIDLSLLHGEGARWSPRFEVAVSATIVCEDFSDMLVKLVW